MTLTIELPDDVVAALSAESAAWGCRTPADAAAKVLRSRHEKLGADAEARLAARGPGEPRIADDAFWDEMDEFIERSCGVAQ